MVNFTSMEGYSHSGGIVGLFVRAFIRLVQFALALTVAGLYGVDLHRAQQYHIYADGRWVYAEVVAGLSAFTCIIYALPFVNTSIFFAWDFILFILYTALFGIFGKLYIHDHPTPEQGGQIRMKHAVWVDLSNMLLWLSTSLFGLFIWLRHRRTLTTHTGRAVV